MGENSLLILFFNYLRNQSCQKGGKGKGGGGGGGGI